MLEHDYIGAIMNMIQAPESVKGTVPTPRSAPKWRSRVAVLLPDTRDSRALVLLIRVGRQTTGYQSAKRRRG